MFMYNANSPVPTRSLSLTIKPLAAAMLVLVAAGQAHATVNGGTVSAGVATIGTSGAVTTINQLSDRAVINWNSFDIGANEKVQINQPASTSATLNRVHSSAGTRIDGELTANGRVFVVNPNGVTVGATGKINANGVVLSTLDVNDSNFVSGVTLNFRRLASAPEAAVVNDGSINASDAGISLIGTQVINSKTGVLQAESTLTNANAGVPNILSVNLIAADSVDMRWDHTRKYPETIVPLTLSGLSIDDRVTGGSMRDPASSLPGTINLIANDGTIVVAGGKVHLQAAQSDNAEAVRNTGLISGSGLPSRFSSDQQSNASVGFISGGGIYLGGTINTAGMARFDNDGGPLVIDGSVFAKYDIMMVPGLYTGLPKKNDIYINAGATVYSGQGVVIGGTSKSHLPYVGAISIDGNVTAMSYFNVVGDTISVNGSIGGYRNGQYYFNQFIGNNVQLREGSVFGPYYAVTVGNTTNYFTPQQNSTADLNGQGNEQAGSTLNNTESSNTKLALAMDDVAVNTNSASMAGAADSASIRINDGVQAPASDSVAVNDSVKSSHVGKDSATAPATHNRVLEASKKVKYVRPVVKIHNTFGNDQAGLGL